MEIYKIENLSFRYPNEKTNAVSNISFSVNSGDFITLCGKSGCGKTTLLQMLKPLLAPAGEQTGKIFFCGIPEKEVEIREQAAKIGFITQNPDNQIVTDKVWHELAFGLENLGYPTPEIRARVSEMASFFGIQTWFHKGTAELSGGQKQLLNLASVMVMQPEVIILDEPTSQLDPIAAQEFLNMLKKINSELGNAVILSEHNLEYTLPLSDRVIVMDGGEIIADDKPQNIGKLLKNHDMYYALPTAMRIYGAIENGDEYPLSIRDGRRFLENFAQNNELHKIHSDLNDENLFNDTAVELKDVWFRYDRNTPDIVKGLNLKVNKGEIYAIAGGNGTGKTTSLSLISGIYTPYRGDIFINNTPIDKVQNLYNGILGVLPQNVQTLFVKKTVRLDLADMGVSEERIAEVAELCDIEDLLDRHPYDLSGGEQQKAAFAKILLKDPDILLLDEPTKGMDVYFKEIFGEILKNLKNSGKTVIMVSHDIEFCAEYADRCAMFFDGNITSEDSAKKFFAGKSFYTTAANRMAGNIIPDAVLAEDIITACGGRSIKKNKHIKIQHKPENKPEYKPNINIKTNSKNPKRIFTGIIFSLMFILTCIFFLNKYTDFRSAVVQFITIAEITAALSCFLPSKKYEHTSGIQERTGRRLTKRTIVSLFFVLFAIPLTIFIGTFYWSGRKYYFISLLIILEILVPFFMIFEGRKPKSRELAVISVLCMAASLGRAAFFMLPQFKPTAAIVIIAGICFGGETGFLVGAVSGFISGFFFGQGPWTPWQMISFGLVGFMAGILFRKGFFKKTKISLCIFGLFSVLIIYGGIMNPASVIMSQEKLTAGMLAAVYAAGFPFDFVHAVSTAFFLWFAAEPMIEKLDRIKIKYDLL